MTVLSRLEFYFWRMLLDAQEACVRGANPSNSGCLSSGSCFFCEASLAEEIECLSSSGSEIAQEAASPSEGSLDLGARRRRDGIYKDRHVGKKIMRAANKVWLDAPAAVKQRYDVEGAQHCEEKRQAIAASTSELAASLQVLTERAEEMKLLRGLCE